MAKSFRRISGPPPVGDGPENAVVRTGEHAPGGPHILLLRKNPSMISGTLAAPGVGCGSP